MGVVLMLSGQGAQKAGMGVDLFDVPAVDQSLSCASDVFGCDVRALCKDDQGNLLTNTRNAQAAIAALSVGVAQALLDEGLKPQALLGFSLGQASALAVSGMLTQEAAFALTKRRSELMDEAASERPGAMTALLKAEDTAVEELCLKCSEGQVLVPANYNCPGQIVISGDAAAIERAEAEWAQQGGRFARLATSGAFHSPLMQSAADAFSAYLETVEFSAPAIPVICNTDAQTLSPDEARVRMACHLTRPVYFHQSVSSLVRQGASEFVEAGPGAVLANLVKRICRDADRACVQDRASFNAYVARLRA